jgi:cellobiose-specific phosphotransferase system component IIC
MPQAIAGTICNFLIRYKLSDIFINVYSLFRCFVVAFSNATLTVVPQKLMSSLNAEYTTWPQQPLKLLTHNSRGGLLVVCIDSTVWHLTLSDDKIVKPTFT